MRISMTQSHLAVTDLAGLLERLVDRIPGAESAVLLTTDGHAMASWGGGFPRTTAQISRLASTVRGLAGASGPETLGPVWRTVVMLDHELLALAPAGPDAVFGVTLNGLTALDTTLDSVLDDTATAAEHAGRVLAAHDIRTVPFVPRHAARDGAPAVRTPLRRRTGGRHSAEFSAAQLNFRDPAQPTDDQLERMLSRLRSL
ncbi:roadblock/LC7 domain-containing protein [Virgisporangium ochraceum]|nr:roadblock/LC7 domain-containing protein [Virgisporangium ochraceum]